MSTSTTGVGNFNTQEVQPWDQPIKDYQKTFQLLEYHDTQPELPIGLTSLDMDKEHNLRIRAEVVNPQSNTFTAKIWTWYDTKLYSAGMSWIEKTHKLPFLQSGTFDTNEIRDWRKPQHDNSKVIQFSTPFSSAPKVACFLTYFDMEKGKNWRLKVIPSNITSTGFKITIKSWFDSVLYGASATWVAYPSDMSSISSGRFSTGDIRDWRNPQQKNSSRVDFNWQFTKPPSLFVGLDEFDYNSDYNLRLKLETSDVTTTGFKWNLDAWFDSEMYQSGASYLAWDADALP
ncbi:uncharacterized protein N7498_000549 [Penicillium cinerascens]|uniref:H-type lectin domain-containing protein n=1 Tax=Penicillium cinerascens TaxID=70096 RepID=A0A9W9TEB4_9EURO|nr:uncharacterized protein N7498_000549 [Penicillium cinerascens]KAJ5218450.1 hypothetical protein N7498_000549 [Penicillium cinerascens]